MQKRKKGAQGIPTQSIQEQQKVMRFVAQAICFKKDDKHLAEQVFMEAATIFKGDKCGWTNILEKALTTQMIAVKGKGQKLYNCAPIWQAMYKELKGDSKKRSGQEKESKRNKKVRTDHEASGKEKGQGSGSQRIETDQEAGGGEKGSGSQRTKGTTAHYHAAKSEGKGRSTKRWCCGKPSISMGKPGTKKIGK